MLGVCSACLAAMARGGAADPKQSALRGDAEAMPHPRENGCFPGLWQEGRTTLGLNSALPGRLWLKIKIRCDGAAAQSTALRARLRASKDLGAAFTTDARAAATPSHQGDTVPLLNPHILT